MTKEQLAKHQKRSSGNLVKAGTNRLGRDVCELMVEHRAEKEWWEKDKMDNMRQELQIILSAHVDFYRIGKAVSAWTVKDHEIVLRVLRRDKEEKFLNRSRNW